MRYCDNCGQKLADDSKFCPNCGKRFNSSNQENNTTVIICAIVGLLFPLIGAILYYVFKNSDVPICTTDLTGSSITVLSNMLSPTN